MKFGTTYTFLIVSGLKRKIASRRLGSSFQNAHATSTKISRRRISAACASVGALESGFTVDPWPTMSSALSDFESIFTFNVRRRASSVHLCLRIVQGLFRAHDFFSSHSFSNLGSLRIGSHIGSRRSRAEVISHAGV